MANLYHPNYCKYDGCRFQLRPYTYICPKCRTVQFNATSCLWCYRPIPDSHINCPHCYNVQTRTPNTRPCFACDTWLLLHDNFSECYHCRTPQDYKTLKATTFKRCCNPHCLKAMVVELFTCPFCRYQQSGNDVIIPFDTIQWLNPHLLHRLKQLHHESSTKPSPHAGCPQPPTQLIHPLTQLTQATCPFPTTHPPPTQTIDLPSAQPTHPPPAQPTHPPPAQPTHPPPAQPTHPPPAQPTHPPPAQPTHPPPAQPTHPPPAQPTHPPPAQPTHPPTQTINPTLAQPTYPSLIQANDPPPAQPTHPPPTQPEYPTQPSQPYPPSASSTHTTVSATINTTSTSQGPQQTSQSPQSPLKGHVQRIKRKLESFDNEQPTGKKLGVSEQELSESSREIELMGNGNQAIYKEVLPLHPMDSEDGGSDPVVGSTQALNHDGKGTIYHNDNKLDQLDKELPHHANIQGEGISDADNNLIPPELSNQKVENMESRDIEDNYNLNPIQESQSAGEENTDVNTSVKNNQNETGAPNGEKGTNTTNGKLETIDHEEGYVEVIAHAPVGNIKPTSSTATSDNENKGNLNSDDSGEKPNSSEDATLNTKLSQQSQHNNVDSRNGGNKDAGSQKTDLVHEPVNKSSDDPLSPNSEAVAIDSQRQSIKFESKEGENDSKRGASLSGTQNAATHATSDSSGKPSTSSGDQGKQSVVQKSPRSGTTKPLKHPVMPAPLKQTPLPEGFCSSNETKEDKMCVVFRALVHKETWGWDESSEVYMRFGGESYGKFGHDFGPGLKVREFEDFVSVKFFCHLKCSVLRRRAFSLTYKYTVFTSKTTKEDEVYEFLNEAQSGYTDRHVTIPSVKCNPNGRIIHFDNIIYPEPVAQQRRWYQKVGKSSAKTSQFKFDEDEMSRTALKLFLLPAKELILNANYKETFRLFEFVENVVCLFNCLFQRHYHDSKKRSFYTRPVKSVKKDSLEWIGNLINELDQSQLGAKEQLWGSVLVLMIYNRMQSYRLSELNTEVDYKNVILLFQLIGFASSKCGLNEVTSVTANAGSWTLGIFEEEFKKAVKGSSFAVQDMNCLLKILPCIHTLKRVCGKLPTSLVFKEVIASDSNLNLVTVKTKVKSGMIVMIVNDLKPYLDLDPLLSLNLIYLCPVEDFSFLCKIVEPNLAIDGIARNVDKISEKFVLTEVKLQWVTNSFVVLQRMFFQNADANWNIEIYEKSFLQLKSALSNILQMSDSHKQALCLFCLTYLTFCIQNKNRATINYRKYLSDFVRLWVRKGDVIGSGTFGTGTTLSFGTYWQHSANHLTKELQLWNFIMTEKTSQEVLEATPQIKEDWNAVINAVLESRISRIPEESLGDFLSKVEIHADRNDSIMNLLMSRTSTVLEQMFQDDQDAIKTYFGWSTKSSKIAQLVGKLLTKRYPAFNETVGISLAELLEWNLWPGFLTLQESFSKLSMSKERWEQICASAMSQLHDVCDRMSSGQISISEIRLLKRKKDQISALCDTSVSPLNKKKMQQLISLREEEYDYFTDFKAKLLHFINCLKHVPIKGHDYLFQLLNRSNEKDPINSLCVKRNKKYEIACYSEAKPLFSYLESFFILNDQHPSTLFNHFWKEKIQYVCSSNSTITFDQIVTSVWIPVMQDIDSFITSLKNTEIEIAVLDRKLQELYENDLGKLQQDLTSISTALSFCRHGTIPSDLSWVNKVTSHIADYWRLRTYCQPAVIFLKFRDDLKLTGNFSIVEQISEGVEDVKYLSDIDPRIVEAGSFLQAFATDKRKQECLQAFVDCPKIVNWIRTLGKKETSSKKDSEKSNVNDLQNFVNIALATAAGGEGDLNTAKLINLRIIGSGFGPLIYNLPQTADYDMLQNHCKTLWATLDQTRDLPTIMRSCEDLIDWYSSVRETQGSVEKTSFGQMRNVNKLGVYEVGSIRIGQLSSRSEAVCVRLRKPKGEKESLPQYRYTFEELRDLESKLVLITGNESPERKDVDRFLDTFHCVCRIADVLMQLQHYGNTSYIQWCLKFSCSMTDVYDLLAYQAKKMESDLASWLKEVKDERDKFYELNYFTTPQLLVLSEELGLFEASDDRKATIKPSVMNLLYSISEDLNSKVVRDSLSQADLSQELEVDKLVVVADVSLSSGNATAPTVDFSLVKEQKLETKSVAKTKEPVPDEAPGDYPKPSLTLEDLTPDQLSHFYNIQGQFDYHTYLILLGFERCAASSTMMEDVTAWCEEHELDFDFPDEDKDDDIDSSSDMSGEFDTEDDNKAGNTSEDVTELPKEPTPSSVATVISTNQPPVALLGEINVTTQQEGDESSETCSFEEMIETIPQVPLDKNHPLVKELLELDFELEASIKAVQKFPNDVSHAIHYLERTFSIEDSPSATKEEKGRFEEEAEVVELKKMRIEVLDITNRNYMSLSKLGKLLQHLAKNNAVVSKTRSLPETIKASECNLVVVPPEFVLKTTLSIYMESPSDSGVGRLPLPTHEEVLICTEKTTPEEVTLLWKRAFDDPGNKRIFCLVHAELLNYQVCDSALRDLQQLSQDKKGYKIVIICSNEEEEKSNIIAKLQSYRRPYQGIKADKSFLQYLMPFYVQHNISEDDVSLVDIERSRVRILSSARAGMGKSFYIQKMAETLCQDGIEDDCYRVVPIHGPRVDADSLVKAFDAYLKYDTPDPCIYHIDVSQTVLRLMDTLLFNLLILQTVCDSKGRVWKVNSKDLYAIEVTIPQEEDIQEICRSTVDFIKILPSIECKSPLQVLKSYSDESDEEEFSKPTFQRVYQYLCRDEEQANLDEYSYILEEAEVLGTSHSSECLELLLDKFSVKDPSWSELRHFISFLNEQLECSENSVFCNSEFVRDIGLAGFKTFVVKFMIIMSKDFCTSSLKGEVAAETGKDTRNIGTMEKHQISEEKKWHKNYHPYLFFNKDGYSITFVGFNVIKKTGDVIDPVKGEIIMRRAIKRDLYDGLENNRVNFDENYYEWSKDTMVEKIGMVMGINNPVDPDPTYVLTPDNVIKILAIQMKFRCNIPVVIMGETGCGKTRLIRYMCDLAAQGGSRTEKVTNMLIMKVHGGITPADITKMVLKAEEKAESNKREYGIDTVLFFDEANTTDAIGLIKEVMCDRRLNGTALSSDLKFIAACNPYRKHHKDMISKLESAGLGFYVKATEAQEKLGEIPLRQLVYRVFDLPPSMRPLIYDFGKLDDETEDKYTRQMVKDRCSTIEELASREDVIEAVSHILTWSQSYMKRRTDECSFVSLRDVERALIVFKYFFTKRDLFFELIKEKAGSTKCVSRATWALIISLSVCYHARLQDRDKYEKDVVEQFNLKQPLKEIEGGTSQPLTQLQFQNELKWCQDVLLDHMTLGANIARNAALKENVFMMAICVQLKIPLFLVGKPGSSKSLAKSIIADSMNQQAQGFLKDFNEVHMFSYQCSQLSTPESVIEVFTTARKFQEDQKTTKFTSVVVLDEVGLAEDSPNLPLKALHPLLEDGTEGTEDQQIIAREKRVAFIGISNWALDPAKMNRGVMVTRADPNCDELILSAEQICASDKKLGKDPGTKSTDEVDALQALLKPYFSCLSKAYTEICVTQIDIKRSFFGLRDFYSLIKMLFFMCKETKCKPSDKQLEHAIKRNFGGFESKKLDTYQIFKKHLRKIDHSVTNNSVPNLLDDERMNPDCSPLGLIEKSLRTKTDELSQMGESRYLLFLTENYAALQVLQYKLREAVGITKQEDSVADMERSAVLSSGFGLEEYSVTEKSAKPATQRKKEPFVLFGSSFPKDREYTQVCRNINQIKICMETGRTVILLNLENLYESLYDLLNQYYILLGNSRYVDLGLQTHRVKCRVDNDFKLILIAERETVYKTFPTPLINRLEKHFVLTETILLDWQKKVLKKLRQWIEKFSQVKSYSSFKMEDAIVGYQHDTPAAVIFQVTKLKKDEWGIPNDIDLANYNDEIQESSRDLLLQMASPDALIRLKLTNLEKEQEELCRIYFDEQKHDCLTDFVKNQLLITEDSSVSIQITTHSHLLSSLEIEEVYRTLGFTKQQTTFFLLQEFDTELDFTKALDPVFSESHHHQRLLIIQCDSGHLYGDLIASARYRIDDQREKTYRLGERKTGRTHVLLIVHLPRYAKAPRHDHSRKNFSFVGFQGGAWTSAHIDDIHVTSSSGITLNDAMSASISELFYNMPFNDPEHIDHVDTREAYHSLVEAFTAEEKKETTESGKAEEISGTKHTGEGDEVETEEMEDITNRDDYDEEDMQLDEEAPVIQPEEKVPQEAEIPPLQPPEKWAEKLPPQLEVGLPEGQAEEPLQDQGIPEEELMKELPNDDEQHGRESEEEGQLDVGEFQFSNEMMGELEHEDSGPRYRANEEEEEPMNMYKGDDQETGTEFDFMFDTAPRDNKMDSPKMEQLVVEDIEGSDHELSQTSEPPMGVGGSDSEGDMSIDAVTGNHQENEEQAPKDSQSEIQEADQSMEVVEEQEFVIKRFLDLDRPVSDKAYTQCSRLHYCIQSVIAMIAERDETKRDWAAKRVKLLLEFIPEKAKYPIGIETFHGALVWRILLLLEDRETVHGGHTDWVVEEACNATSLHSGGTFQNVLARKIDRVLIPLFANILAFTDCYYNLEIIRNKDGPSLLQQLWLRLFNHPDICSFKHFYSATDNKNFTAGGLQYTLKQDFKCQFPFFWVIQDLIDAQLIALRGSIDQSIKDVHLSLHNLLLPTPLAEALCIIPIDQIEAYCQYYLHDFLQTIHHPTHTQKKLEKLEIEVLDAVIYTVTKGPNLYYGNHLKSLLSRIIAVHVVYEFHQKEIMWLGQLTSILPGLVEKLKLMDADGYNPEYIDIHLHAVQFALDDLELPLDPSTKNAFPERNLRLQICQNIVSSILEGTEPVPFAVELRHYWNYIRVIKLFVEHVALKYPDLIVYPNRMKTGFKRKCDCSKLETLQRIQHTLTALETKIIKEKKNKLRPALPDIQKRCKAFLSEVISTIFFGEHYNQPEPELIAALIEMVFKEHREASEAMSRAGSNQSVPAMRSFLLQLLLEYNIEDVIKQLNDHIHKSRMVIQEEQGICLLCIQCLEDAIFKRSHSSVVEDKSDVCIKLLKEGSDIMKSATASEHLNITIEYLEAVAKIRFVCFTVTEMLYTKSLPQTPIALSNTEQGLVQLLHTLCEDSTMNDEISGPGIFLLKHIARQYGMSFLGKVMSMEYTKWIIPAHLRITDQDQQPIMKHSDLFTGVYEEYHGFNECLTDAVLSKDLKKLDEKCQHLGTRGHISLILALYQVVSMSHGYPEGDSRRLTGELKTSLLSHIKKIRSLSRELMTVSEVLINCSHCDKLDTMRPSFDQGKMQNRLLTEVVVHTATVFRARKDMFIFKPFVKLLTSPGTLKNSYLPTCPGSMLNNSVKAALGGAFNKCPKGHPYFIDKCGDLTEQHTCPECGIPVPVLQVDQISEHDNKLSTQDQSFTGYTFGDPDTDQPQPTERNLNAHSCAVLRVLMNACLTWTACANETATGGLMELTKSKFSAQSLPSFFWRHLENSVRALSKKIQRSEDDTCLLIHLILKQISTDQQYPNTKKTEKEGDLKSEEHRAMWENSFSLIFINPIIVEITGCLNKAKKAVSSKESQEHDPLHYAIYEKVAIPGKSVTPHLWTYRPRITMEAFFQELQLHYDDWNNHKYPILQCLSEHNLMLRATQYLPEIVKLQQLLCEMYHRKIDRVEAGKTTVAEFINNLSSQSAKEKAKQCFESTKEAWLLARNNFPGYSRQYVSDEYKTMSWDIDTLPIVYIIPSLSGPGVCTSALLEGLVQAHNTFIENCQFLLKKRLKNQKNIWAQRKVPVKHVQHCHLVEYRQQLLSMVLSHCRYTLNHGEEQQLTYEFDALEKRFVDQFVHGRPTIELELPQFKYRQDAYSIANVKRTVPQQELNSRAKSEIITELKTAQSLRSTLDIVEIIMGFMASGQYGADMKLSVFVTKSLKMKDQFPSKKALEHCSMKHVLCLWTILSVEMAKSLLQNGQEPFSCMGTAFLAPITKRAHKTELEEFLQGSNVEGFLYHLFEFIEGFIKHSQHYVNAGWSLYDSVVEFNEVFEKCKDEFPQCFTVGHAVSVWKEAAGFVKTKVADK